MSEVDRLTRHLSRLREALDDAICGQVVEVWNGRYGNKMKYNQMTYEQIEQAITRCERRLADEQRVAEGGSRRGAIGLVWEH